MSGSFSAEPAPVAPRRDDYALAAGADADSAQPARSRRGTTRSTGPAFRPASSTRPRTPSTGASRRPTAVAKAVVRVELSGARLAERYRGAAAVGRPRRCRRPRRRGRASVPAGRRTAAARRRNRLRGTMIGGPTAVTVGADVDESPQTRERVRDFARARLARACGRRVPRRDPRRRIGLLRRRPLSACIDLRICSSRSAAARWRSSYCSSTERPSGVSAASSVAPIAVP